MGCREGIIELLPAKCHDEILRSGGSVWAGIAMKQYNTPTKRATSLDLDHTTQFLKSVPIDTCVDCWAFKQEFDKQNAFSVTKHCAHDLANLNGVF
jgi:hypothetical protein